MNNATKSDLKELPIKLKLDLYAEVVIAALIEQGRLNAEKLYVRPKGTFYRSFQFDLAKIDVLEDKQLGDRSVFADVNREGLYDMLPEGIFHKNLRKTKHIDTQESVQELELHKKEEKHARQFFLPLEQMFYQQRIAIEIEEQRSLIGLSETIVEELISNFWNISLKLTYYQSLCLVYMLPMIHKIVGNFPLTEQCLQILLQVPVSISRGEIAVEPIVQESNKLGSLCLGGDFILNDEGVHDLRPVVIELGPLGEQPLADYFPQGSLEDYLNLLTSYFIPATLDWKFELIPNSEEKFFELGDIHQKGILNYTTVI
ncbi:MAG: hypothetical protein ACFB15_18310 [Cyclobacteriaceae bacterium]